uniref:Uncharacterized protein n=1 Tax=Aureoumbra lagunensis TaxID=44058 RepID=A0A7S3K6U8_9STRA|mmetsp:Transcript_4213/g.5929  ORF Transcript_4213/g.5929 Transcript_4213/m.5929 type:complete len:213 (+) Transcript_4213:123-761(+)
MCSDNGTTAINSAESVLRHKHHHTHQHFAVRDRAVKEETRQRRAETKKSEKRQAPCTCDNLCNCFSSSSSKIDDPKIPVSTESKEKYTQFSNENDSDPFENSKQVPLPQNQATNVEVKKRSITIKEAEKDIHHDSKPSMNRENRSICYSEAILVAPDFSQIANKKQVDANSSNSHGGRNRRPSLFKRLKSTFIRAKGGKRKYIWPGRKKARS